MLRVSSPKATQAGGTAKPFGTKNLTKKKPAPTKKSEIGISPKNASGSSLL